MALNDADGHSGHMKRPGTIIFDLDGTLIHSAPDLHFAANAMLAALDRPGLDLATVTGFIGNGVDVLVRRCLDATGGVQATQHARAALLFMETYSANMTRLTRPYPGVIVALEDFRAQGIPLGICTNKPTKPALAICEALNLARFFDVIAGAAPDIPKKPDAAPLLACIEALGQDPSRAVYVGDSVVDYHTARNANVRFHLYGGGYLNGSLPGPGVDDRFDDWAAHRLLRF